MLIKPIREENGIDIYVNDTTRYSFVFSNYGKTGKISLKE